MLFNKVTKEHILQGIADFEEKGFPKKFGPSSTYDVVYEGKKYPPKAVMAYANHHASGRKVEKYFKGGDNTECFQVLRDNGFKVEPKSNSNKMENTKQEFAKWLLKNAPDSYNQYLGNTVQSVVERLNEIQAFFPELDFFNVNESNLSVLKNQILSILKKKERVKKPEFMTYDKFHSSGIPKAIIGQNNYIKFLEEKFNQLKKNNNQELYDLKIAFLEEWSIERLKTMSLQEYTNLDKTSFCYWLEALTSPLGSIWGGSAYKFGIFKRKDIESDNYNEKRKSDGVYAWYGKYGDNTETVFKKIKEIILEIVECVQNNNLEAIDNIDLGDSYKWKIAFLYGNFNVVNIFKKEMLKKSAEFLGYNKRDNKMSLFNQFILSKKGDKDFFDFSKSLWERFDKKIDTDKIEFQKQIDNSNPTSLNIFFSVLDKLIEELSIENTDNLVFSTKTNKLSFQVGKRYCLNLKVDSFDFIAPENYQIKGVKKSSFAEPDVATYFMNTSYNVVIDNYKAITDAVQFEIERDNHTFPKEYDNSTFRLASFDKEYRASFFNFENIDFNISEKTTNMSTNSPLNQILFGPPGTGKTYNTINKALEICNENLEGLKRNEIKDLFEEKVNNGQIVFSTFHQSMTYEDFVEGIKPIEPENEGDPVIYKVEDGIFRKLCIEAAFDLAKENESQETENVLDFSLAFDNFLQNIEEKLTEEDSVELSTKNGGKVIVDGISQQGNIIIKHPGKDNTYPISKKRLAKLHTAYHDLNEVHNIDQQFRAVIGGSNSTANWAVLNAIRQQNNVNNFKTAKERSNTKKEKKEVVTTLKKNDYQGKKGKPYVLIIDEINRGNVSQIFGELITLIETDKRLGKKEALQAKLPYSKEMFGVPHNIFILGTMNTADRSVEALDTALRRRFSFIEMAPKPELIIKKGKAEDGKIEDIDLSNLLNTLNRRIEKLLDKDHMIGHSYFLSVKNIKGLKRVFQNKIIPLLQEYFFGDYGKIGLVLGEGFFQEMEEESDDDFFAPFEEYDSTAFLERKVYKIHNTTKMSNQEFVEAIHLLIRK